MSAGNSWQQIVVTTRNGKTGPSFWRFLGHLRVGLEQDYRGLGVVDGETPDEHTDPKDGTYVVSFGWHDTMGVDEGAEGCAAAIAERWPESEVYYELEWWGDDAEVKRMRWTNGKLDGQADSGNWQDEPKPTPAVGAWVHIALAEWGKDDGDEMPLVRVALTPGTAKLAMIIALNEVWQQAPGLFKDDGPKWMAEHPFVDGTLVADVDIDEWWDGFHDATTAPFTSIIEQEVQL